MAGINRSKHISICSIFGTLAGLRSYRWYNNCIALLQLWNVGGLCECFFNFLFHCFLCSLFWSLFFVLFSLFDFRTRGYKNEQSMAKCFILVQLITPSKDQVELKRLALDINVHCSIFYIIRQIMHDFSARIISLLKALHYYFFIIVNKKYT